MPVRSHPHAVAPAAPEDRPDLEALPVELALDGPDAERTAAWVEGVVGWQPVAGDGLGLAPRVRLADLAGATTVRGDGVPTVLLVPGDAPATAAARAATACAAAAVVAWPDDRDTIVDVVGGLLRAGITPAPGADHDLRVGSASGGVGTTTVALALAALTSWASGRVLCVTHGVVPLAVPRTVTPSGLAGPRAWGDAHPVPSVPGLRVVRATAPAPDVPVDAQGAAVVRDLGATDEADVLCVRRDAAGVAALERSASAAVVALDDGLVPWAAVRGAAAGRPLVRLPRSTRVARAGVLRQVPAALPGSYLRALAPLVAVPARAAPA